MSPPRSSDDVRIEILCEKLKHASLSVEERDDLADDLRRAELCKDPGTKDILISNVRRAMSEPARVRRELEGALSRHQATCVRAEVIERSIGELKTTCDKIHEECRNRPSGSSVEFSLPPVLGGRTIKINGGAVYLCIFVVSVLVFMWINQGRRAGELRAIRSDVMQIVHPTPPADSKDTQKD